MKLRMDRGKMNKEKKRSESKGDREEREPVKKKGQNASGRLRDSAALEVHCWVATHCQTLPHLGLGSF
jgi:hypothetical protein